MLLVVTFRWLRVVLVGISSCDRFSIRSWVMETRVACLDIFIDCGGGASRCGVFQRGQIQRKVIDKKIVLFCSVWFWQRYRMVGFTDTVTESHCTGNKLYEEA